MNFRAHVIGFDVTDVEFEQLQCIATATGGDFFRANTAKELKDAIASTVAVVNDDGGAAASAGSGNDSQSTPTEVTPATLLYGKLCETCDRLEPLNVSWNVFKDNTQHHRGLGVIYPNDTHQFGPGTYDVAARLFNSVAVAQGSIEIGENGQQIGALNLNAGSITTFAFVNERDEQQAKTALYTFYPILDGVVGPEIATAYDNQGQSTETWLNAGRYKITVSLDGNVTETTEIDLAAGEQIEHVFDLRSGVVAPKVLLHKASLEEVKFGFLRLIPAGGGEVILIGNYGNSKAVKPGAYDLEVVLSATLGRVERRFLIEVAPGDRITGPFVMDAVLFKYSFERSDGGDITGLRLLSERKDKSGFDRKGFAYRNPTGTGIAKPGRHKLQIANGFTTEAIELDLGDQPTINIKVP